MRRQRRSITDIICENCKYLPTKRSRNKPKPIQKESDVKTFNYTAHLWDIRWLREGANKSPNIKMRLCKYLNLIN
ncbi:NinE family protein [Salmonella enterica subsp. enterica serovar Senftenberg]|nr:NinE family protein [Salmonella enterica subsp. enterica serovar Senftenberg]